ncbi:hypothetical protein IC575_026390 [Cucumis melo]
MELNHFPTYHIKLIDTFSFEKVRGENIFLLCFFFLPQSWWLSSFFSSLLFCFLKYVKAFTVFEIKLIFHFISIF